MEDKENIPNAKPKLPVFSNEHINTVFPSSDSIDDRVKFFVYNNMKSSEGWQHGRETLDDIIGDLIQYRKGLATPEEYLAKDWL